MTDEKCKNADCLDRIDPEKTIPRDVQAALLKAARNYVKENEVQHERLMAVVSRALELGEKNSAVLDGHTSRERLVEEQITKIAAALEVLTMKYDGHESSSKEYCDAVRSLEIALFGLSNPDGTRTAGLMDMNRQQMVALYGERAHDGTYSGGLMDFRRWACTASRWMKWTVIAGLPGLVALAAAIIALYEAAKNSGVMGVVQ